MLYIVGLGPSLNYLSLKALSVLSRVSKIYIDTYTSIALGLNRSVIESMFPQAHVIEAKRRDLEDKVSEIIEEAAREDVAILVPGDPLTATTHNAIRLEALKKGVKVEVIPAVSGLQLVISATGLSWYKFGRPVTLVYPEPYYVPLSVVEIIWSNLDMGLHTLVLLDLRIEEGRAMTISEAIKILLELEERYVHEKGYTFKKITSNSILVGVARAGLPDSKCVAGDVDKLLTEDYPPPPHTLIVAHPDLSPIEEESLRHLCGFRGKKPI